jgi:hypothetical protein
LCRSRPPSPPVPVMMKSLLPVCCLCAALSAITTLAGEKTLQVANVAPAARARSERAGATGVWQSLDPKELKLRSAAALVVDQTGNVVYARRVNSPGHACNTAPR